MARHAEAERRERETEAAQRCAAEQRAAEERREREAAEREREAAERRAEAERQAKDAAQARVAELEAALRARGGGD